MRSLYWMREAGYRVIFDATHFCAAARRAGDSTSGDGVLAPALARAAIGNRLRRNLYGGARKSWARIVGWANQIPLKDLPTHLRVLKAIHAAVSGRGD